MKAKDKNSLFILSITEEYLKVVKCLLFNKSKVEFVGLELQPLPADIDDKKISEKLEQLFKKLDYKLNPVIISLPRSLATCRYLKVPASGIEEIENIVNLQAPRYLPYPADELITAFQVISTDKGGYSYINLIIAHKDTIERYLKIFKELKAPSLRVMLSSYGLCNLYNYIKQDESATLMLIEIDSQQAELVIISSKKLFFSRSFKLTRTHPNWINLLIDEINKTQDVFSKEISQEKPLKIVFVDSIKALQGVPESLNKQMTQPVEVLSYTPQIISLTLTKNFSDSEHSFASLIGLGLEKLDESLNLLPKVMKNELKNITQRKRSLHIILLISVIILVLGLGMAKDLDNKQRYLGHLKVELQKFAKVAKPVEDIEKRLKFLETRTIKKPTAQDILYELHQTIPSSITLINLNYEEDKQVVLRGQTPELSSVFVFVEQLEKSHIFGGFNVKVRYATGKKVQTQEFVDFEIVCLKK